MYANGINYTQRNWTWIDELPFDLVRPHRPPPPILLERRIHMSTDRSGSKAFFYDEVDLRT
jgi:hypothetical protein